jgi:hypothetical protein
VVKFFEELLVMRLSNAKKVFSVRLQEKSQEERLSKGPGKNAGYCLLYFVQRSWFA